MHSEHKLKAKLQGYAPRVCGIRYSQASQPSLQATGEWVGDEKIAERRVATKASQTSQSSPRVFSEIFCSTHPERGASQPTRQVPQEHDASQPKGQVPPAGNASPPSWNASPNPSPIKQPESQVFKPPESKTRLQPTCSLTLHVLHRKFTGPH